jgi:hypothetical protein
MVFQLLNSPARPAPGPPFARAQTDDAGRVDCAGAIETIAADGARRAG